MVGGLCRKYICCGQFISGFCVDVYLMFNCSMVFRSLLVLYASSGDSFSTDMSSYSVFSMSSLSYTVCSMLSSEFSCLLLPLSFILACSCPCCTPVILRLSFSC